MRLTGFWVCLWIGGGRERNQARKALRFGAQIPLWETPTVQEDEGSPGTPPGCRAAHQVLHRWLPNCPDETGAHGGHAACPGPHGQWEPTPGFEREAAGPCCFLPFLPQFHGHIRKVFFFFFSCSQLHSGSKGMVGNLLARCQGWGQESVWAALAIQMFHSFRVCGEGVVTARLG